MDTSKVWGIILIVVGVILTLIGIINVYHAFSVASQMSQVTSMFGGAGGEMAKSMVGSMESMVPSKIPGLIMIAIGVASAFFGNKMLKKVRG